MPSNTQGFRVPIPQADPFEPVRTPILGGLQPGYFRPVDEGPPDLTIANTLSKIFGAPSKEEQLKQKAYDEQVRQAELEKLKSQTDYEKARSKHYLEMSNDPTKRYTYDYRTGMIVDKLPDENGQFRMFPISEFNKIHPGSTDVEGMDAGESAPAPAPDVNQEPLDPESMTPSPEDIAGETKALQDEGVMQPAETLVTTPPEPTTMSGKIQQQQQVKAKEKQDLEKTKAQSRSDLAKQTGEQNLEKAKTMGNIITERTKEKEAAKAAAKLPEELSKIKNKFDANKTVANLRGILSIQKEAQNLYDNFLKNPEQYKGSVDTLVIDFENRVGNPQGAVRVSTFNKTLDQQSWANKVKGWFERGQTGGLGLTDADRKAALQAMKVVGNGAFEDLNEIKDANKKAAVNFGYEVDDDKLSGMFDSGDPYNLGKFDTAATSSGPAAPAAPSQKAADLGKRLGITVGGPSGASDKAQALAKKLGIPLQ